jgi:hypothetical protein
MDRDNLRCTCYLPYCRGHCHHDQTVDTQTGKLDGLMHYFGRLNGLYYTRHRFFHIINIGHPFSLSPVQWRHHKLSVIILANGITAKCLRPTRVVFGCTVLKPISLSRHSFSTAHSGAFHCASSIRSLRADWHCPVSPRPQQFIFIIMPER